MPIDPHAIAKPIVPLLLSYQDAADLLTVSDRYVWQLVADGLLPCVRMGRAVRIHRADLDRFIESAKVGKVQVDHE